MILVIWEDNLTHGELLPQTSTLITEVMEILIFGILRTSRSANEAEEEITSICNPVSQPQIRFLLADSRPAVHILSPHSQFRILLEEAKAMSVESVIGNESKEGIFGPEITPRFPAGTCTGPIYDMSTVADYTSQLVTIARKIRNSGDGKEGIVEEYVWRFIGGIDFNPQQFCVVENYLDRESIVKFLAVSALCGGLNAAMDEIDEVDKRKLNDISHRAHRVVEMGFDSISYCEVEEINHIYNNFIIYFFLTVWGI